jgi:hypothetical protein
MKIRQKRRNFSFVEHENVVDELSAMKFRAMNMETCIDEPVPVIP